MSSRTVRRVAAWAALGIWMGVIFWFSAQPATVSSELSGGVIEQVIGSITPGFADLPAGEQEAVVASWQTVVRKGAHVSEYAVLGILAWLALGGYLSRLRLRAAAAAGIGLLYAASDEIHQIFVPGRGPGVVDVLIDFSGVCIGVALAAGATALWRGHQANEKSKTKKSH